MAGTFEGRVIIVTAQITPKGLRYSVHIVDEARQKVKASMGFRRTDGTLRASDARRYMKDLYDQAQRDIIKFKASQTTGMVVAAQQKHGVSSVSDSVCEAGYDFSNMSLNQLENFSNDFTNSTPARKAARDLYNKIADAILNNKPLPKYK